MPDTLIIGAGGIGESNSARRQFIGDRYDCPAFATWTEARAARPWKIAVIATPARTYIPIES